MIASFKHRGLKRLYEKGDRSGIRADLLDKVERILTLLDAANAPEATRGVSLRSVCPDKTSPRPRLL